jgi:hypothetical protein
VCCVQVYCLLVKDCGKEEGERVILIDLGCGLSLVSKSEDAVLSHPYDCPKHSTQVKGVLNSTKVELEDSISSVPFFENYLIENKLLEWDTLHR